jgi:hypothetical protein
MSMEIEKARENIFLVWQIDHASIGKIAPCKIRIDFQEFAVANDNACVAADAIVDGVEEPAAPQDNVACLKSVADLSERDGSAKQQEYGAHFHRAIIAPGLEGTPSLFTGPRKNSTAELSLLGFI